LDNLLQKYPDLRLIIERWPKLPEHVKKTIKTLIQTHQRKEKINGKKKLDK
jgi:hypothetical protein